VSATVLPPHPVTFHRERNSSTTHPRPSRLLASATRSTCERTPASAPAQGMMRNSSNPKTSPARSPNCPPSAAERSTSFTPRLRAMFWTSVISWVATPCGASVRVLSASDHRDVDAVGRLGIGVTDRKTEHELDGAQQPGDIFGDQDQPAPRLLFRQPFLDARGPGLSVGRGPARRHRRRRAGRRRAATHIG